MELLDDRAYLEPPDNKAKAILECFFCGEDIYEGDDYYVLNSFDSCEKCLDIHFKWQRNRQPERDTAEKPEYDS